MQILREMDSRAPEEPCKDMVALLLAQKLPIKRLSPEAAETLQ